MHRTAVAVLTISALALAGCSSSDGDDKAESKPSATAAASPSGDPVVKFMDSVEDAHLASYEEGIPPYQELEVFPPKWCSALDEGHSVTWMLGTGGLYPIGLDWGTEKSDAYQLVLLGAQAYCPKRAGAVRDELREAGAY